MRWDSLKGQSIFDILSKCTVPTATQQQQKVENAETETGNKNKMKNM